MANLDSELEQDMDIARRHTSVCLWGHFEKRLTVGERAFHFRERSTFPTGNPDIVRKKCPLLACFCFFQVRMSARPPLLAPLAPKPSILCLPTWPEFQLLKTFSTSSSPQRLLSCRGIQLYGLSSYKVVSPQGTQITIKWLSYGGWYMSI